MLNLKWNREDALQAAYEEGYEEGENRVAKLVDALIKDGKQEEFQIALTDKAKRNEYFKRYDII